MSQAASSRKAQASATKPPTTTREGTSSSIAISKPKTGSAAAGGGGGVDTRTIVATPDEGDGFRSASFKTKQPFRASSNWFGDSFSDQQLQQQQNQFQKKRPNGSMSLSPNSQSLESVDENAFSSSVSSASASALAFAKPVPSSTTTTATTTITTAITTTSTVAPVATVSSPITSPSPTRASRGRSAEDLSPSDYAFSEEMATSTPIQATLNTANVMLGMGILTLPYGLHIAGWVLGISMLTLFAFTAHFTAKLLAKCMNVPFPPISDDDDENTPLLTNPHRHRRRRAILTEAANRLPSSLTDVVELAFGPQSRPWINFIFMFELFAAATGLIILGADSIVAIFPELPMLPVKIAVTVVLVLSTMPRGMGWLAYSSFVGVLTVASLFLILVFNGLRTPVAPGSLWDWEETDWWPRETSAFGEFKSMWLAAGLFIIGLDAHAIFPGIYRDLKQKEEWGHVVEGAYFLNWSLYAGFAACGYLMFGVDILPQVTQNFPLVPSYPKALTQFIVVLTALNPFTKYALIMAPVHLQMEQILGIPTNLSLPPSQLFTTPKGALLRIVFGIFAILTTILFPTFHVLIGLVGSLFSFMIVGVIPCLCYLRLGCGLGWRQEAVVDECRIERWEMVACWCIVGASVAFGGLGTVASIFSE